MELQALESFPDVDTYHFQARFSSGKSAAPMLGAVATTLNDPNIEFAVKTEDVDTP
jgi:hypothetical protein